MQYPAGGCQHAQLKRLILSGRGVVFLQRSKPSGHRFQVLATTIRVLGIETILGGHREDRNGVAWQERTLRRFALPRDRLAINHGKMQMFSVHDQLGIHVKRLSR